jgi:hypothetical protein
MSIFPSKIHLATAGSEEVALSAQTAADLANKTNSELHIIHVRPRITPHYPGYYIGPGVVEDTEKKNESILIKKCKGCWKLR